METQSQLSLSGFLDELGRLANPLPASEFRKFKLLAEAVISDHQRLVLKRLATGQDHTIDPAALPDLVLRLDTIAAELLALHSSSVKKNNFNQVEIIYNLVAEHLDTLTEDLGRRYLSPSAPLPYHYGLLAAKALAKAAIKIPKALSGQRISKPLLEIALRPIQDFSDKPAALSWSQLGYFRELCQQLLQLADHAKGYMFYESQIIAAELKRAGMPETRPNIQLNILLLHLNFNSAEYVSYCIANLQRKLADLPDNQRLSALRLYAKMISQVVLQPDLGLLPEAAKVNKPIKNWIDKEIEYLSQSLPGQVHLVEKIDTTLSVGELSVLLDLFFDTNIISDTNRSKVYRVVAGAFNTKGSDEVSAKSLRSKVTNQKDSARISMREKFWDLYNRLR